MSKSTVNNVKLGLFIMAGLLFLILLLYLVGKNKNLLGSNFLLKARFENAQGLMPGNNVRLAGIVVGTVRSINILSDTLVEVNMMVKKEMQPYIHKNAMVTIGSDGLIGNKLVNIVPSKNKQAPIVEAGDTLAGREGADTDAMLLTLQETTSDLAVITESLKYTLEQVNSSHGFWSLMQDSLLPRQVKSTLVEMRQATAKAHQTIAQFQQMVSFVQQGEGSIGALFKDTLFANNLNAALVKVQEVGSRADTLAQQMNALVTGLQRDIENGRGTAHALLKDSAWVRKLDNSLQNVEAGTAAFNENMEALKHNFLFRGYFRKQARQQKKEDTAGKVPVP